MTVYLVLRVGFSVRDCGGVFTDEAVAKAHALALQAGEPDNYHSFAVVPYELDELYLLDSAELSELPLQSMPAPRDHLVFEGTG